MSEQTRASLRVTNCLNGAHYIVRGRKAKLYICTEHRHRADFALLVEKGLLIDTMMNEKSETKCEAIVFKGTVMV